MLILPSGHWQETASAPRKITRRERWILGSVLAVLAVIVVLVAIPAWTMLARLYIGAHHVSDVLTEFVLVSIWIWACPRLLLPARSAAPDRAATRAEAATPA